MKYTVKLHSGSCHAVSNHTRKKIINLWNMNISTLNSIIVSDPPLTVHRKKVLYNKSVRWSTFLFDYRVLNTLHIFTYWCECAADSSGCRLPLSRLACVKCSILSRSKQKKIYLESKDLMSKTKHMSKHLKTCNYQIYLMNYYVLCSISLKVYH